MKTLFDETKISKMNLKNRFIRSAVWEGLADEKGHVTDELIGYYENLANGGVGTIITGFSNVMEFDQPGPNMIGIYDDVFIDELEKLTSTVHKFNANMVIQIVHGGPKWGPSAVEDLLTKTTPKEMDKDEITEVVQAFADAALRAKKAGFDGVQLHAAHGFLLNQFLNPYYNRRSDDYGGPIENRAKIVFESYKAVKQSVGDDFPVFIKMSCEDFMDGGLTFDESLYVCKILSDMSIDAIEVSGGSGSSRENEGPIRNVKIPETESYFKDHAAKIAEEVKVPVALVGGNRSVENMGKILNSTKIEYFSMARPFLSEPNLVNRWMDGDTSPAQCISCSGCAVEMNGCIRN